MSTIVLRRPTRGGDLFALAPYRPYTVSALRVPQAPAVVLDRDGEDGVLVVEAPGLDPARDLSVDVTGSQLTVAGTRRETTGHLRRETRFARTVTVPEGLGADAVTARYDAGVLRVRVAGMFPVPAQPETVRVAITSDAPTAPAVDAAVEQPAQQPDATTEQQATGEQPAAA